MSVEENKAMVRRLIEEWNKGNTAVLDDVIAPDCVIHGEVAVYSLPFKEVGSCAGPFHRP